MEPDKITEAFLEIEKLKLQCERIVNHIDSERGTLQRESTRLREEIATVEKMFREIIYDTEKGLLIKVDRLTVESVNRRKVKSHIIALWIGIIGIIVKEIIDYLKTNI